VSLPKKVGLAIALFVTIGVGLGLSGYISITAVDRLLVQEAEGEFASALGQTFVALVAIQSAFVVFLLGSVVATISGSRIAAEASSLRESVIANGVASFIGFYAMVAIALVIMLAALGSGDPNAGGGSSSGGGPLAFGDVVQPMLLAGAPTAFVGVASGGILKLLE